MKQAHVVHVIVTHLRQTKEVPEKKAGERNLRKKSSYKVSDQYGKAKSRKQSFFKSQLAVQNERKSNSDRPKTKTAEKKPSSENRPSANGKKLLLAQK